VSSLFLFGAGASFGSGACTPYPPPLGSQLFLALQAAGGIAATVDAELAAAFVRNFEDGMDLFWARRNEDTTRLLRDMARYFAPFEPLPGNYYGELLSILGSTRRKAVLVTTNYDLLIEHSVVQAGLLVAYGGPPVPKHNVPVLKIHGSCNFLPNLLPRQISGIRFDLSQSSDVSVVEAAVKPARNVQEIIAFCGREDSIAPALAMYSQSKQALYCRDFIQAQRSAWLDALADAARAYVVGLGIHLTDRHIWEPLARSRIPLFYVGREPDEFVTWAKSSKRRKSYVLAESFAEAVPKIAAHHRFRLSR
jgi:hypothetical protein